MGPSSFTENELNDIMLEIDPNEQAGSDLQAFGTADDLWGKEGLIQSYFEVVSAVSCRSTAFLPINQIPSQVP